MIYTYWRWLLLRFGKIFLFSLSFFIVMIMVTRFTQIAEFIALGAQWNYVLLFMLYQIPYILPFGVPVSSLLASALVMHNLSSSSELTALRASGISTGATLLPLIFASTLFSLGNFALSSEISTRSHYAARHLLYRVSYTHPMVVLKNQAFLHGSKNAVHIQACYKQQGADEMVLTYQTEKGSFLFLARHLEQQGSMIIGKEVSIIPPLKEHHVLIENQHYMTLQAKDFANMLQPKKRRITNDQLSFSLLRKKYKNLLQQSRSTSNSSAKKTLLVDARRCYFDLWRRLSFAIAPLSLSLLGATYGLHPQRSISKRALYAMILLSACFMSSLFFAQALDRKPIALFFLFLPHGSVVCCSMFRLWRFAQGRIR